MRIYRVKCDVNSFQSFFIDRELWKGDLLSLVTFDCAQKSEKWMSPPVYVLHPKLSVGNFYNLESGGGAIVVDAIALGLLRDLLEQSGELLALPHHDKLYHVLNVTECINVLDTSKTEWMIGKSTGARIGIKKYVFHKTRLTETPLFKIPETCRGEILTCEGLKDPDVEFKTRVERLGLKGLTFEEVWAD